MTDVIEAEITAKLVLLSEIIEAEIKEIDPHSTINDKKSKQTIMSLLRSSTKYRKMYDGKNIQFAEKVGEVSDMIDVNINIILNDN